MNYELNDNTISNLGSTDLKKLYDLYARSSGYTETPPTIQKFISDPYYLGQSLNSGEAVFPYWKKQLLKIYPTPFYETNNFQVILLSGATGIGKCLSFDQEMEFFLSEEDIKKYNLEDYIQNSEEIEINGNQ